MMMMMMITAELLKNANAKIGLCGMLLFPLYKVQQHLAEAAVLVVVELMIEWNNDVYC